MGEEYDEDDDASVPHVNIDEVFFDIAMLCPKIQVLSAQHVIVSSNLNLVVLKCPYLMYIDISCCSGITNSTIKAICSSPVLGCLDLENSEFETDTPNFSTYKSPSIYKLHFCDTKLSRAGRINLCACFPFLTCLSAGPVSGDELVTIAASCPLMEMAYIRIEGTFSDKNATSLCKHWPRIELLHLESVRASNMVCSEQAVLNLLRGCPELLKLSVCCLDFPHSPDYLYGNETCSTSLKNTPNTTAITASTTTTTRVTASKVTDLFLETLTEATMRIILTLCPQLNTLSIRHNTAVKPPRAVVSDQQRAAECALSCLNHPTCSVRKLHLHNIRSLAGVDLLSLTCLEELQLSNIGIKLRNEMLLNVVKNNPNLCSISLYNCEFLRSHALILPLLKMCPALHTFNFTECDSMLPPPGFSGFCSARLILEDMINDHYPNITTLNLKL